jgi:hypothetical protein
MPSPPGKDQEMDELDDSYESDSDPNVFKIRDPLNPPSAKIFSTQELHSLSLNSRNQPTAHDIDFTALIHEGMIDLNPPYQRGGAMN